MPARPAIVIALTLSLTLSLLARHAGASSVAYVAVPFERAVAMSARVVKGKVIGTPSLRFEGDTFHSIEVRVESVLKGAPARSGETLRLFSSGEWFRHTHAAAIKGGVVSYAENHYAHPVPRAALESGAPSLFFLAGDAAPPGFPANAAFLVCGEAYESGDRAPEVARIKTGAFGDKITLKMGERAFLPEGLQIQVTGHSHKRPTVDGPRRETAEVLLTRGTRSERLELGHVIDGAGETWGKQTFEGYEVELLGMTTDADTTLRVARTRSQ